MNSSVMEALPLDIIALVLAYLPVRHVRDCALVCRRFRDAVASSSALWQSHARLSGFALAPVGLTRGPVNWKRVFAEHTLLENSRRLGRFSTHALTGHAAVPCRFAFGWADHHDLVLVSGAPDGVVCAHAVDAAVQSVALRFTIAPPSSAPRCADAVLHLHVLDAHIVVAHLSGLVCSYSLATGAQASLMQLPAPVLSVDVSRAPLLLLGLADGSWRVLACSPADGVLVDQNIGARVTANHWPAHEHTHMPHAFADLEFPPLAREAYAIRAVAWCHGGELVACAHDNGFVTVWRASNAAPVAALAATCGRSTAAGALANVAWMQSIPVGDGDVLMCVSCGSHGGVVLWDLADLSISHALHTNASAVHASGSNTVMLGDFNGSVSELSVGRRVEVVKEFAFRVTFGSPTIASLAMAGTHCVKLHRMGQLDLLEPIKRLRSAPLTFLVRPLQVVTYDCVLAATGAAIALSDDVRGATVVLFRLPAWPRPVRRPPVVALTCAAVLAVAGAVLVARLIK